MSKTAKTSQITKYVVGFVLSLLLTLTAYIVTVDKLFTGSLLVAVLLGLAIVQLAIQVLFFLHIDEEEKPRWALLSFIFMLLFVAIIVVGSLWIMHNLDYKMMPKHQIDQAVMEEEAIYR